MKKNPELKYEYIVFWKEITNIPTAMWYRRKMDNLVEAKHFAKNKKQKSIPLKPYIVERIAGDIAQPSSYYKIYKI